MIIDTLSTRYKQEDESACPVGAARPLLHCIPHEGHAHAARAAATAGELGAGQHDKLEARLGERLVCGAVALVDADAPGRYRKRVGAVVPLLARRGDRVSPAAADEPHGVEPQDAREHAVKRLDDLLDVQLPRTRAGRDAEHL